VEGKPHAGIPMRASHGKQRGDSNRVIKKRLGAFREVGAKKFKDIPSGLGGFMPGTWKIEPEEHNCPEGKRGGTNTETEGKLWNLGDLEREREREIHEKQPRWITTR